MVMENQRIAIIFREDSIISTKPEIHYTDRELSEKDFKKWYNHLFKEFTQNNPKADIVDMLALYEDHIGETCELANFWGMEYMKHCPYIPFF